MNRRLFLGGLMAFSCQARLWNANASPLDKLTFLTPRKASLSKALVILTLLSSIFLE